MGCRELLGRLSAYLDGDLSRPQCRDIEQHCRQCRECARIVEGLRKTIGICQDAGRAPLPEAIRDRARASIQRLLDRTAATRAAKPRR
jgi:anti-sigma factor RsiW